MEPVNPDSNVFNWATNLYPLHQSNTSDICLRINENGRLEVVPLAQKAIDQKTWSYFQKFKHFFGYGTYGYSSVKEALHNMALEDFNLQTQHLKPNEGHTIAQYIQLNHGRIFYQTQASYLEKKIWEKFEPIQNNLHSAWSKTAFGIIDFVKEFRRSFNTTSQAHNFALSLNRYSPYSPFVTPYSMYKYIGSDPLRETSYGLAEIKETAQNSDGSTVSLTFRHVQQSSDGNSRYELIDNTPLSPFPHNPAAQMPKGCIILHDNGLWLSASYVRSVEQTQEVVRRLLTTGDLALNLIMIEGTYGSVYENPQAMQAYRNRYHLLFSGLNSVLKELVPNTPPAA